MLITGFGSYRYHGRFSQQHGIRIGASALVLAIALICISCGSVAQADLVATRSGAVGIAAEWIGEPTLITLCCRSAAAVRRYQFSVASGKLPPGLTLNAATGSFTGEPSSAGNYTFAVSVTDSPRPDRGTQTYTVTIKNGGNGGQGIAVSISPSRRPVLRWNAAIHRYRDRDRKHCRDVVATAGSVSGSAFTPRPR